MVDLGHVAEQNVLLVVEGDGDEVHHARVVHLISVTLEHTHMCMAARNNSYNNIDLFIFPALEIGLGSEVIFLSSDLKYIFLQND